MEHDAVDLLAFQPSSTTSIGIEIEVQIVDRETCDTAPGALPILRRCRAEGIEGVSAEFMQSMIEIKTGVCANVTEAERELVPLLRAVRNVANSLGYAIALSGTHPFGRASANAVFPNERYERIRDRLGWVGLHDLIFGVHVHIGVPGGDMAIALVNALTGYLPHLLAVSANSPFWQGVDTGLASFRSAFYGLIPHAGLPPYFRTWKAFRSYLRVMLRSGAIGSIKDLYWDIRPRPDYGTIEVRVCDTPSSLAEILGLAALTRSLVVDASRRLAERPELRPGDRRAGWLARENKWLAARHGLEGSYIRTPSGKRRSLAHDTCELVARLAPIARESGDDRHLRAIAPGGARECGFARQRRIYRETGRFEAVTRDQVASLEQLLAQSG